MQTYYVIIYASIVKIIKHFSYCPSIEKNLSATAPLILEVVLGISGCMINLYGN